MGKDKKEKKSKKDKAEKRTEVKEGKALKQKKSEKKVKSEKTAKPEKAEMPKKAEKATVAHAEEVQTVKAAEPAQAAADNNFNAMDFVTAKIGGKWKMKVVYALRDTTSKRYSEIKANVPGITDMMLSSSLKELVEDGLVERKQFSEVPLRVEYQISQMGERLTPALEQLVKWAVESR